MSQQAINEPAPIERRLRKANLTTGKVETITEDAIADLCGPIVILGDPGIGKSKLAEKLGHGDNRYVRAGQFVRSKSPDSFLPKPGGRLIIDGLDEVASATVGGGVDAVLAQLSAIGNPPFILSGREADWRGASARVRIEDDYGEAVSILHLDPFDRHDAELFLRAFFDSVDASIVLNHLSARGLEEIYHNPLTLKMIGEVARTKVTLPGTRAELLESACTIMLSEENPRHQDAAHALRSDEDLLLASGAICASLLLCDRSGVYVGPTSRAPEDTIPLASVQDLPLAEAAPEARQTRLFQADGESRFIAVHRVIAEYLGARWLAACFDQGATERRIRSLITLSGGIPTSLRGLNAWLAHFSGTLAPACIAADPYAVLRYGNAETLPLEHARVLLRQLAKLSSEDPYFRAEDWTRHPAMGLMRMELKNEIQTILLDQQTHAHLVFLLLEAIVGSPIAGPLGRDLKAVLFDPDRVYGARSRAADALLANDGIGPTKPVIESLLALGDADSQRLAFEILTEVGLAAVPMHLSVETLLAHSGLTESTIHRNETSRFVHISRDLFSTLSGPEVQGFLDNLAERAGPLMRSGDHLTTDRIADAARTAVLIALQSDTPVTADQVWRWLRWVAHYNGYDTETKKALQLYFEGNSALRRSIQAVVLLSAPAGELRSKAFGLGDMSAGLIPNGDDVIALIELFDAQSRGVPDLQQLRDLVSVARNRTGLASSVREAAKKVAGGDPAPTKDLDEWSKPFVDYYETKQKSWLARDEAKRQELYQSIRLDHVVNAGTIRAGDFRWLNKIAKAYLGRFSEFSSEDTPEVRVETFLGAELANDALIGFVAALHRTDLPSAVEIAELHAKGRHWLVEIVLVCGIAEMVRREISLYTVPRFALDSAYMWIGVEN